MAQSQASASATANPPAAANQEQQSDYEFPQQRSTMMQQKAQNRYKQEKRETEGQSNRSRSASRRARRQRIKEGMDEGRYMKTSSLEALEEADANGELQKMQPFERIGPDSTSMNGPVTYARAMRGEIPNRSSNPNDPYYAGYANQDAQQKGSGGGLDDQEGLKLKLEANLEIEVELKASIRGDLTLSLLN